MIRKASRKARWLLCLVMAGLAPGVAFSANKDDRLVLTNGDRLTGELKGLERGYLSFKTDATDTISVEWDTVAELASRRHLEVETTTGERHYGTLQAGTEAGLLRVEGYDTAAELLLNVIVRITPIESTILSRMDGDVSLGYTYTQASGVSTLNFSASYSYRVAKYEYGAELDSDLTDQETGSSSRQSLILQFQRFLPNRWFTNWNPQFQSNEDLGIDLRVLLPVALGRNVVQTNHILLTAAGGLAYNQEWLTDAGGSARTLESLGRFVLDVFRDDFPRADMSVTMTIYPGLTEWGRLRGDFDARVRYEILKDFFIQMDLKDSYDNQPEDPDASKNDIVLSTSLAWSF